MICTSLTQQECDQLQDKTGGACGGEEEHRLQVGQPPGNKPLARLGHRWGDNTEMHLSENMDTLPALVSTLMNLQAP